MRPRLAPNRKAWLLVAETLLIVLASSSLTEGQGLQAVCSFYYTNGAYPYAGLALSSNGSFLGTTSEGGRGLGYYGTVFQVTTNGTLTSLASFSGTNGANPYAALTLGADGNSYGTTAGGGSGSGTVFGVTTNGALASLASFGATNGTDPRAALTLGPDGNFYGSTPYGGINNYGTIFKVATNGTLTSLLSFYWGNGAFPMGELTLAADGCFYGTTWGGGNTNSAFANGMGTVFRVTTNGTLTSLAFFDGVGGANPSGG